MKLSLEPQFSTARTQHIHTKLDQRYDQIHQWFRRILFYLSCADLKSFSIHDNCSMWLSFFELYQRSDEQRMHHFCFVVELRR